MTHPTRSPALESGLFKDQLAGAVDNAPAGYVRALNRNGQLVLKDSAGNETLIGSGAGGTNYYDNGSFESGLDGASVSSGVGTITAETTDPLEGDRSAKLTQGSGAALVVDFAIGAIDNYVLDGSIVPLSEAIIKLDAADADADANFGIWNDTDSTWLQGPVDLLGGGVINVVRELCNAAPLDGKTYVGRLTRVDNTDTREILVDRLRLDPLNGGAVVPEASSTGAGLLPPPTLMSDELATAIGHKAYYHGTSYNGGNAPTVTSTGGAFTSEYAQFIPYQLQDGTWRMRFTAQFYYSIATSTPVFSVNGILAPSSIYQRVNCALGGFASATGGMDFNQNSNNFQVHNASSATHFFFSGDVVLASKPSWAY